VGYPENILAEGEHVVVHRHPHWKALVVPTLGFLVVTALAGVAAGFTGSSQLSSSTRSVLWIVIAVVWAVVAVWFFLRPLVSWRTTHFVLTDRRVTFRNGILTRSGIDIPLQRINSVEFRHGLVDRMLRTGTLIIESASDDPLAFHDIPQVEKVHALLYHEVFDTEVDPGRRAR
jgi:uncharacterized membrane protein YdbT with pleckstrin-like domain